MLRQPGIEVCGVQHEVAGHPGHQDGRNVAVGAVGVHRHQPRRRYHGRLEELQVPCLLLRHVRLLLKPAEQQVPAEHQPKDGPTRPAHVYRMHRRRTPTAEPPYPSNLRARPDSSLDPAPGPRRGWQEVRPWPAQVTTLSC